MAKDSNQRDNTEALLKALGHETRRKIMRTFVSKSESPASPREVAAELRQTLSNVSYHVRVLANCDAIALVSTKAVRGSIQHFYLPSVEFMELPWVAAILDATGDEA